MLKLTIALAAVAVLAGCAPAPARAAEPPPHPCATATEVCTGTIAVPLNWADPASERIEVTFQRVPRRDLSRPATGTILAHLGGAPSPSIGAPGRLEQSLLGPLGPVHDRQDVVVADLRGLGASTPLACTGVDVDVPETVADCGAQLGPRATWFALDQAVQDYEAVRAALGVPRLTLFGNSWGSELAQAYASRYPDRVAAVFLNGAVPATDDGYLFPGGPYAFVRVAQVQQDRLCAATPACAALPGSTQDRLDRVAAALRAAGEDVTPLVSVLESAAFTPATGRDLDAALQFRLDGDPAPLGRLLAAAPPPFDRPVLPPDRAAQLLVYICSGAQLPYDRGLPTADRLARLDAFYAEQRPFAPFTPAEGEAGAAVANTAQLCAHWPWLRESAPVHVDAPHPDVPVLQVAGDADPTTVDAATIGDRFPGHTLVRIPGGVHQTWDTEHAVAGWCARDLMRSFLLDPAAPLPGGCDWTTWEPLGSFPRTSAGLPRSEAPVAFAAFAAAVDATMPHHQAPADFIRAGVRGGTATGSATDVRLQGYRFVEDVAVDGTVVVDAGRVATATLSVAAPDGVRAVTLTWPLLDPDPEVTGTVDGRPVTTRFPPL